jgi:putative hydrolase of HD superfamily
VEIDAGDTYAYDRLGRTDQPVREEEAARRIFSLLPADQTQELHDLWREFEAKISPEAKFANAVDRLMPLLHNYHSQGKSWLAHGVNQQQVIERMGCVEDSSEQLWEFARSLIEASVAKGYLLPSSAQAEALVEG